MKLVVKQLSDG